MLGVSCGTRDLLTVLGLHYCGGFSLVPRSVGYSVVALHGILIAVAFLVEHGLYGRCPSVVAASGL